MLLGLFGNELGYPHVGNAMSATIRNLSARNCGHSTTYPARSAVICADRGCNVDISGIQLINDEKVKVNAFFRGDFSNVNVSNVSITGDFDRVFEFSRFAEVNSIGDDIFHTCDCRFTDVRLYGTCNNIATASKSDGKKVLNTHLQCVAKSVSSGDVIPRQLAKEKTLYCDFTETNNNARVSGYATEITGTRFENAKRKHLAKSTDAS